jgi:hypothetical protein
MHTGGVEGGFHPAPQGKDKCRGSGAGISTLLQPLVLHMEEQEAKIDTRLTASKLGDNLRLE